MHWGVLVAIFVLFFSRAVELVAMPAIAGALILVGVDIIRGNAEEFLDVWDVSLSKRLIMLVTLAATLILPVQNAVLLGVLLSFFDFIFASSERARLMALRLTDRGTFIEEAPPTELADDSITVLTTAGNAYFAAVRTLQTQLPVPGDAQRAVVILRLRHAVDIGTTLIAAIERYAAELAASGSKVMLSGVREEVLKQLEDTETLDAVPREDIFVATPEIGESTRAAIAAAEAWQRERGR